eukprot:scaffold149_cov179-Amphora_coffeaeformis.AAC.13
MNGHGLRRQQRGPEMQWGEEHSRCSHKIGIVTMVVPHKVRMSAIKRSKKNKNKNINTRIGNHPP